MNKILASCVAVAVIAAAAIGFVMLNNHSSDTGDVDDKNTGDVDGKKTIAVTMNWEQGIVEQITGGNYNVATMLGPGANPHTAVVTPENIKDMDSAVLYFKIGSHVEWEEKYLRPSFSGKLVNLTESAEIDLLDDEGKFGRDLHIWTSLDNLRSVAGVICDEICCIDPDHSGKYKRNLEIYMKEVEDVDGLLKEVCEICKDKHRGSWDICVWHPAWQYFCQYANDTYKTSFRQVPMEAIDGSLTAENIKNIKDFKSIFVFSGDDAYKSVIADLEIETHVIDPTARDMLGCLKNFVGFLEADLKAW